MNIIEISRALLVRRRALLSPVEEEFAILIELRDARSVVPIGDKHRAVREPCQKGRTVEVGTIGAFHLGRADGLNEFLSIVRELVNGVHVIIQDPHMLFRIIGIDGNEVRSLQNFVPLSPPFDDVAVGIRDDNAVFPLRVNADCA